MVEPKIDSLHEPPRDVTVVVLHENDASLQARFAAEFVNFLDQRLPCFIARMRFAGENELHWARRIVHQASQSFFVAEQKCAALISCEPPRKTDGQNFRIKNAIDFANRLRRFAQSFTALSFAIANKIDEAAFKLLMRLPQLRVGNIDDAAPKFRLSQVLLPLAEMLAIKCRKFGCHPSLGMNAVGDTGDRHLMHRNARPHIFPERSAYFTVQFTYPIRMATEM